MRTNISCHLDPGSSVHMKTSTAGSDGIAEHTVPPPAVITATAKKLRVAGHEVATIAGGRRDAKVRGGRPRRPTTRPLGTLADRADPDAAATHATQQKA